MRKSSILFFASVVALSSSPALAVSTLGDWDGSQSVGSFGCPNTTTYGQVITIPQGRHTLNKFSFEWENSTSGSMTVRGEVYAWDGSKATGSALYESDPRNVSFNTAGFRKKSFAPFVAVTPGAQYVVFASIDKDFESCTDNYTLDWGSVDDSTYTKGTFVYQNNSGDESQWTTASWNTFGIDLAFKVDLAP